METDCYKIEVLHYSNPHLIWIEVVTTENGEIRFEQVGIYGIMPMEVSIDMASDCVKGQKSLFWSPAICNIMEKIFDAATEIWFRPVFIDRSSSIFDSNVHKYGEIIIKNSDGITKDISTLLTKSCFAYQDTKAFLNAFASSDLKTKLNSAETRLIIKILEKKTNPKAKKQSFKRHTTVTNAAQNLESALTESNVNRHNKLTAEIKDKLAKTDDVIENKHKDFELCKDADEVSAGRGISTKLKVNLNKPTNEPMKFFLNTKTLLLQIAKVKGDEAETAQVDEIRKEDVIKEEKEEIRPRPGFERELSVDPPSSVKEQAPQSCFRRKPKRTGFKIPDYDADKEVRVAIGPPDIDRKTLMPKIIPKTEEIHGYGDKAEEKNKHGVDSDANINVVTHTKSIDKFADKNLVKDVVNVDRLDRNDKKVCVEVAAKLNMFKSKTENEPKLNVSVSSTGSDTNQSSNAKEELNDTSSSTNSDKPVRNSLLKRYKLFQKINADSSSDSTAKDLVDSKIHVNNESTLFEYSNTQIQKITQVPVNPFVNIDPNASKFVDKLVRLVLMVHSRNNKRIQPVPELHNINFNKHIHTMMARNSITHPMTIQSVSWFTILRGYSIFMIGLKHSGKTVGYIPAVCRLVTDFDPNEIQDSVGPICIIVCGTTRSVVDVETQCRQYLENDKCVVSSYAGVDDMETTTALLNGCHVLICTPPALVRLLNKPDFGVDLKRLQTFVLDDCERLNEVYLNEVMFFQLKIKELLKARVNKELKVQIIVASRIWCDFMEALAKKTPNVFICIGSFQECVLYSKSAMSISFVDEKKKMDAVLEFLFATDRSKRTVIMCRFDDEVDLIEAELKKRNFTVLAANDKVTVHELSSLSSTWDSYDDVPLIGPILVCCDGNLTHLNITNAHYLLQYSQPQLYSMFANRFKVLADNYPSIFSSDNEVVKIKILIGNDKVETLPKILHFVKRCQAVRPELSEICATVLKKMDSIKARNLVPLCDRMLILGECPDVWHCGKRHTVIKEQDEPNDWMPTSGLVTFKILHFHSAVEYSARLIANIVQGKVTKYPQTYSSLSLKMGLYFSKESNRRLHGTPKVGDICAVALKDNFFERCQVTKIYESTGKQNMILVKLIDEEKWETTRDVFLYHLPEELKNQNSHVALVRLATIMPRDKDVTYANIAIGELKSMTEKLDDSYVRAKIITTIGKSIIVETLESCQDLTSSNETVLRFNLKETLLKKYAIKNPNYLDKLKEFAPSVKDNPVEEKVESNPVVKENPKWAILQDDEFQVVYVTSSESPDRFFVRLEKFDGHLESLEEEIQMQVSSSEPVENPRIGDIVLAKFTGSSIYHRARIEALNGRATCFFVDHGDFGDVGLKDIYPIVDSMISLPFQAIECRLTGIRPPTDSWNEYSTNWFSDQCVQGIDFKELNAKLITKEEAVTTGGLKYGVVLVDTREENDFIINNAMLELNLARELVDEVEFLIDLNCEKNAEVEKKKESSEESDDNQSDWEEGFERVKEKKALVKADDNTNKTSIVNHSKLIRSVPLVTSDDEFDDDRWDVHMGFEDIMQKPTDLPAIEEAVSSDTSSKLDDFEDLMQKPTNLPAIEEAVSSDTSSKFDDFVVVPKPKNKDVDLDSDDLSSVQSNVIADKVDVPIEVKEVQTLRRPKLIWRQHSNTVTIKIELIDVEKYDLAIEARHLKFKTSKPEAEYGFDFDLYGIVDVSKCSHEPRGMYVYVRLEKVLHKNWLSLTKEGGLRKWIVYDPDSIEASSSEDEGNNEELIKKLVENAADESESDDEDDDDDRYLNGI